MKALAAGIVPPAPGDPTGDAQGPVPRGAGRPTIGTYSPARRVARFSDLLGGLINDNAPTKEKLKPDNPVADEYGVAFPLLSPGPGNETVRFTGTSQKLGLMPVAAPEDTTAPPTTLLDRPGAADTSSQPVSRQTNPAGLTGQSSVPESFDGLSGSVPKTIATLNFGGFRRAPAGVGAELPPAASAGIRLAPRTEEFVPQTNDGSASVSFPEQGAALAAGQPAAAQAPNTSKGSLFLTTERAQAAPGKQPPGLQTVHPAGKRITAANAGIPPLASVSLQETAGNESQPQTLPRRDSSGERTDRTLSQAPSSLLGMDFEPAKIEEGSLAGLSMVASTAADDLRLLPSTPDPVRLGPSLAVASASDGAIGAGAAATAGASAPYAGTVTRAGLAFTARVVPLPAVEAAPSGTGGPLPASESQKEGTGRAPAVSAPHSSSDLKSDPEKGDSSQISAQASGAQPRLVSTLSPTYSVETPAQRVGESGRAEPPAPHLPPAALTEGTSTAAPAREIQLQLHQGEQRVDVRLTERSGEIRVAVRTPDAQLSGALRADLPALSTRLEQTGFRAETWHPGISHESARPAGHPSSGVPDSSDPGNPSRQGGQQQHPEPRHQKFNTAHAAKSQRKEFRWFMSRLP